MASISPIPNLPIANAVADTTNAIKSARPDIIINADSVSSEQVQALFFENITSKELISIVRNDTVFGKSNVYTPIKNISSLALRYGPKSLIPLQNASDTYFSNFPIKLDQRVPDIGTGPFGQIVYIDEETGDLVINAINLKDDEQIEVQIMKRSSVLDDTIYTGGTD
jgi:hypothetical protein